MAKKDKLKIINGNQVLTYNRPLTLQEYNTINLTYCKLGWSIVESYSNSLVTYHIVK